jgi:hypothetical protein
MPQGPNPDRIAWGRRGSCRAGVSARAPSSLDQALFDFHAEVAAGFLDVGEGFVAGLVKEGEML